MAADRLSIRLPTALRAEIDALSKASGMSESEIARQAIEEYVQRQASGPSCYDIAQKAGLIGWFDSGVSDLSTNPKHMEGFGR